MPTIEERIAEIQTELSAKQEEIRADLADVKAAREKIRVLMQHAEDLAEDAKDRHATEALALARKARAGRAQGQGRA